MIFLSFHSINYVTKPRSKPSKKGFAVFYGFLLGIILLSLNCNSQDRINQVSFVPELENLKSSCQHFFIKQAVADLAQFNYKIKGQLLNYLPSPGWNFATQTPILAFSFSSIFQAINTKRSNRAQAQRIVLQYETQMNSALIEVVQLHESLKNQLTFYNSSLEILDLEKQRFSIVQKDFNNSLIAPSLYLAAQINFANLSNSLNQKLYDLYRSRSELLIKAKKGDWVALPVSLSLNNQSR
jgi:hypothetical protein